MEEVGVLKSREELTFPSALSGPVGRAEDVPAVKGNFAAYFPLQWAAADQARHYILTAFLSLAVALSIALLLQKCFYGMRADIGTENSAASLTRRGSARRLSAGRLGWCFSEPKVSGSTSDEETTAKDGGHSGDIEAVRGHPQPPFAAGQQPEGAGSSGIEASGSSSVGRTARGQGTGNAFLLALRKRLENALPHPRGRGEFTPHDPPPSSEPLLVAIRRKGSTGGFQGDSNVGGRQQGAEAGASSVSNERGTEEVQQSKLKHLKNTEFHGMQLSGRKALGRAGGRKVSDLLAHTTSGSDLAPLESVETSGTSQQPKQTVEETSSTSAEGGAEAAGGGGHGSVWLRIKQLIAFLAKGHSEPFVKLAKTRRRMLQARLVDLEAERVAGLVKQARERGDTYYRWWSLQSGDDDVFD
ncbi:hypothetical protein Emag_002385 [Eimeria magna]